MNWVPIFEELHNKKGCRNRSPGEDDADKNRTDSKTGAKVEHLFLVLKRIFGFSKVLLSGFGQECQAAVCSLRPGQCVQGVTAVVATDAGVMRLEFESFYQDMIALLQNYLNVAGNVN